MIVGTDLARAYRDRARTLLQRPSVSYALREVTITIPRGRSLGIIGESGSGKSTLVRILAGLDAPTGGSVSFDGREVSANASARSLHWLRRMIGVVSQDPSASLDPRMRVGEIIREPLWALGVEEDHTRRVREVIDEVGLPADSTERFPHEFSGGQRQRIAIGRALAHRPQVLIGDEMFSALDASVRAQIIDLIGDIRSRTSLTLVLVSHDIGVVQRITDDIAVMHDGRMVEHGPTSRVLHAPQAEPTRRLIEAVPTLP